MSSISLLLITESQPLDNSYHAYIINASEEAITCTLMDIAEADGANFYIKRSDGSANAVIIQGYDLTQTIDGQTSVSFVQNQGVRISSLGGVWYSITDTRS